MSVLNIADERSGIIRWGAVWSWRLVPGLFKGRLRFVFRQLVTPDTCYQLLSHHLRMDSGIIQRWCEDGLEKFLLRDKEFLISSAILFADYQPAVIRNMVMD